MNQLRERWIFTPGKAKQVRRRWIAWKIGAPIKPSIDQSINHRTNLLDAASISKPSRSPINKNINHSINQLLIGTFLPSTGSDCRHRSDGVCVCVCVCVLLQSVGVAIVARSRMQTHCLLKYPFPLSSFSAHGTTDPEQR